MVYKEIKPTGFLVNFVHCFWEYENIETEIQHTILPDGFFDLIAEFENDVLTTVKLTGVWTKPINVLISKKTKIFAIRFKLLAAEYLFQQEIKSILDTTKDLPLKFWSINNSQSNEFEKFIVETSINIETSIKHLKEIDTRKLKLFEYIYEQKAKTVKEISEMVFWKSRQINRYFDKQFGFPLKTFLNIVRCNETYTDIANGNLYATIKYTDQAHYIKEIRKYTGTTPTKLAMNKNDRFLQLSKTELS